MRDYDIRVALRAKLNSDHDGEIGTLIIEELGIRQGQIRADLAVINGSIHGFEIKSDRDTLERLPNQRDAYAQCFDVVTLVVGSKHADRAISAVPEWWGILLASSVDGMVELKEVRQAKPNPHVAPEVIVEFLWRDEVIEILGKIRSSKGLKTRSRKELWAELVASVNPDELRNIVRDAIKARGDWRSEKREARYSGSSPTDAILGHPQSNLDWLISRKFLNPLD